MKERRHLTNQLAITALALTAAVDNASRPPRSGEIKEDKKDFITQKTKEFMKRGHSKATARVMAKKEWRENKDE